MRRVAIAIHISFPMLLAIRRASSLLSSLTCDRRPAPLASPKCAGYSPAFDRFCVMAQEGVMEFCGNPIF
jgi:hypothetical protein